MKTKTSGQPRRCSHPDCGDIIEPGEQYNVLDGDILHLECAQVILGSAS